jgi:hypothetical protein
MSLGWKTLLPLATVNFMVVALWLVVTALMKVSSGDLIGILVGWVVVLVAGAVIYVLYRIRKAISPGESGRLEPRTITLVDPNKEATA